MERGEPPLTPYRPVAYLRIAVTGWGTHLIRCLKLKSLIFCCDFRFRSAYSEGRTRNTIGGDGLSSSTNSVSYEDSHRAPFIKISYLPSESSAVASSDGTTKEFLVACVDTSGILGDFSIDAYFVGN